MIDIFIDGPHKDDLQMVFKSGSPDDKKFYMKSISTYPMRPNRRDGEPVQDHVSFLRLSDGIPTIKLVTHS
jgi:hypothetical protein